MSYETIKPCRAIRYCRNVHGNSVKIQWHRHGWRMNGRMISVDGSADAWVRQWPWVVHSAIVRGVYLWSRNRAESPNTQGIPDSGPPINVMNDWGWLGWTMYWPTHTWRLLPKSQGARSLYSMSLSVKSILYVCLPNSTFLKYHLQYKAKKLVNKLPKILNKEQVLFKKRKQRFYLKKVIIASKNL